MAITVYSDVILRNSVLAAGVQGRQIRQNRRTMQVSGHEQVNVVWEQTLREYDWSTVPLRRSDWLYLETLHEITDGGAYGFLMEDPKDSSVTRTAAQTTIDNSYGITSGSAGTYVLSRRYIEPTSLRTKDRRITRPRAAGFAVFVSGVLLDPANYTLDVLTGTLTVPSAPAASVLTWTGRFYVPVHFMSDTIDWTMVVAGQDPDSRFMTGPSVILQEIRE